MCRYRSDIQGHEAANGVISSCDMLADLLKSIERFVKRLGKYIPISATLALDDILIDSIVELISTLAVVTQKLNKRRSRESFSP
jgi:hypothetical protein